MSYELKDLIFRALHTAWQTFLVTWPTGAAFTDLSAWKVAGIAALNAGVAALLSALKTWAVNR